MGDHAGQFGHAAQSQLAPAAARIGSAQGLRQRHRFPAQRSELMFQAAEHVLPLRFDLANLSFDARQRFGDGLGRVVLRSCHRWRGWRRRPGTEPEPGNGGAQRQSDRHRQNNSGHKCRGHLDTSVPRFLTQGDCVHPLESV